MGWAHLVEPCQILVLNGVRDPKSIMDLRQLGLITMKDIKVFAARILMGDIGAYRVFNVPHIGGLLYGNRISSFL